LRLLDRYNHKFRLRQLGSDQSRANRKLSIRGAFAKLISTGYDNEVNRANEDYSAVVGDAMAGGASAGFGMINSAMSSEQTLGGGEQSRPKNN
jgi:hypothetical protein